MQSCLHPCKRERTGRTHSWLPARRWWSSSLEKCSQSRPPPPPGDRGSPTWPGGGQHSVRGRWEASSDHVRLSDCQTSQLNWWRERSLALTRQPCADNDCPRSHYWTTQLPRTESWELREKCHCTLHFQRESQPRSDFSASSYRNEKHHASLDFPLQLSGSKMISILSIWYDLPLTPFHSVSLVSQTDRYWRSRVASCGGPTSRYTWHQTQYSNSFPSSWQYTM